MRECAVACGRARGIRAAATKGTPQQWLAQTASDADLIYGGAEYMLDDFNAPYPGFLASATRANLNARRIGVIVGKGNPRQRCKPADLSQPQTKFLNVELGKTASPDQSPS